MNIVIAAGGTAGHVNPAVALAKALGDDTVTFIGTDRGLEASVVPGAGFELDTIDIVGFDRARPARLPAVGMKALGAIGAARRLLRARGADVVVGMGGYVSLPVCLAARSRSIPVVLHEQNIVLGLANRVTKPFAKKIGVSFEETLAFVGARGVLTGNPVSSEIAHLNKGTARARGCEIFGLDADRKTLIIFGGSLGAQTLNVAAYELARRWEGRGDVQILHLAGKGGHGLIVMGEGAREPDPAVWHQLEYTDHMAEAYAVADLALCRGGATTVAELTAVGLASVIVPYPHHRDRQQERHAEVLASAGAARVVPDAQATADHLGQVVEGLLDGGQLEAMGAAARGLGKPDAAAQLAALVREVA